MPSFGPVHKLIVRDAGDPYEPLSTSEFKDYEVEHPGCAYNEQAERYECGVAFNIEGAGARWSLFYSRTPVDAPGEYSIQAWAETYRGFDYTEHDGGLVLVPHEVTDR